MSADDKNGANHGDIWRDWRPEWPARPRRKSPSSTVAQAAALQTADVHARQELLAPTTPVHLRGAAGGEDVTRRRIVDARLWDAMSGTQQDAALQIAMAFETMGRGLGYVSSDWQRIPGAAGAGNAGAAHGRLVHGYVEWTKQCHREKISHAMIIDILVFGSSCRQQDRKRANKSLIYINNVYFIQLRYRQAYQHTRLYLRKWILLFPQLRLYHRSAHLGEVQVIDSRIATLDCSYRGLATAEEFYSCNGSLKLTKLINNYN